MFPPPRQTFLEQELNITSHTVVDWTNFCREVITICYIYTYIYICIYIYSYIYIYRVSSTTRLNRCVQVEDVKLSRKVLYHFANFVIINEILISEDC